MEVQRLVFKVFLLLASLSASARDIPPPPDSVAFGTFVRFLPNGNFVVVDPLAGPITEAGAVYVYSGDGTLISAIRGDRAYDLVGQGGIVVLEDGNFLILSSGWHAADGIGMGAVTWVDASRGIAGVVSSANSLTGASVDTSGVYPLPGGDYAISLPFWSDDESVRWKGAFLWVDGGTPLSDRVTAANALVGSHAEDGVAAQVVLLTNGNVVVVDGAWSSDSARDVGATTFFSPTTRPVGHISSSTSLVGTHDLDGGGTLAFALSNGNYVVANASWARNGKSQVGAVTWGDGTLGVRGEISEQNSIVGRVANDGIAFVSGITPLSNGNYAITSPFWHDDAGAKVGAVTWVDGSRQVVGEITEANSLRGSSGSVSDGIRAVALANGNYVVVDPYWSDGGVDGAGAIVWVDGTRTTSGIIAASNSLVGTEPNEYLGSVTPLSNGNFVVAASSYNDNRGAVRWVDGSTATHGTFAADGSLVGTRPGDRVGEVVPLTDGSYVVDSPYWSDGNNLEVGAVTWASGTQATSGAVSSANSLIGAHESDHVGGCVTGTYCPQVTALPHGAYLVSSPSWDDGDEEDVGAETLALGHASLAATVSMQNSLIGSAAQERFGYFAPTVFDDGTFVSLTYSPDLGVGIVVPRRVGGPIAGIAGYDANDVRGSSHGGGNMTFDYDASRRLLLISDPTANFVTLRPFAAAVTRGHSRHARRLR
jgi:hypothetical protein